MAAANASKNVQRKDFGEFYILSGRKADLLLHGVDAEWFPQVGLRNSRGQAVHTKITKVDAGKVRCQHVGGDRYRAWMPCSAVEVRHREAEEADCASEREERLRAKLGALPPLDPDSLSESEAVIVRIARALDDRSWRSLAGVVESLLDRIPDVAPVQARLASHLRLVVDNTRARAPWEA